MSGFRDIAVIAPIVAVVIGALSAYLKLFLVSREDFRHRAQLLRKALIEEAASNLAALLQHVRSLGPDDMLRGDGRETPDLVGDHAQEELRISLVCHRLGLLETLVRAAYMVLYATTVCGLGCFFLAWLWSKSRTWVLVASLVLIGVQSVTVLAVQMTCGAMDKYEDLAGKP